MAACSWWIKHGLSNVFPIAGLILWYSQRKFCHPLNFEEYRQNTLLRAGQPKKKTDLAKDFVL